MGIIEAIKSSKAQLGFHLKGSRGGKSPTFTNSFLIGSSISNFNLKCKKIPGVSGTSECTRNNLKRVFYKPEKILK